MYVCIHTYIVLLRTCILYKCYSLFCCSDAFTVRMKSVHGCYNIKLEVNAEQIDKITVKSLQTYVHTYKKFGEYFSNVNSKTNTNEYILIYVRSV